MRVLVLALAASLAGASSSAAAPHASGLWVWHLPWTSAPPQIVKDSGPSWHAPGLLLNLCDGGSLRMATGILYRDAREANLGPSDGLMRYEGNWKLDGESVVVRYHLVDLEIRFSGMEEAMQTEILETLRVQGAQMLFGFRRPGENAPKNLRLTSSAAEGVSFDEEFVDCTTGGHTEPSDNSLERASEG